jgi:hypothetical protein
MKKSDVDTIILRYERFDFSQIYGFPNILPKDTYYLSNGPKFNGEDLGLTLENISNF